MRRRWNGAPTWRWFAPMRVWRLRRRYRRQRVSMSVAVRTGIRCAGTSGRSAPDRVWNEFGITGQGVTVASIDTGVLGIHPALRDRYRGALGGGMYDHNYNWYDPQGVFPMPVDQNGHGTHTTGTIVGSRPGGERFGVAPGAQWIAAQGVRRVIL
jgi:subtilisin family serine protease